MREECQQLESKIQHCRKFVAKGFDKVAADRNDEMILELQRQVAEMH